MKNRRETLSWALLGLGAAMVPTSLLHAFTIEKASPDVEGTYALRCKAVKQDPKSHQDQLAEVTALLEGRSVDEAEKQKTLNQATCAFCGCLLVSS